MRILVVEDQQQTLQTLGSLFTLAGHTVTLTKAPSEALAHIASNSPDVILLDIGLPGMNGFQLAKGVRALDLKPRPLIIAYSGYSQNDDLAKGREAGFDYHFPKSVSPTTLLNIIEEHSTKSHPQPGAGQGPAQIRAVK
jgi:DNA-binding response OmpR family regulator